MCATKQKPAALYWSNKPLLITHVILAVALAYVLNIVVGTLEPYYHAGEFSVMNTVLGNLGSVFIEHPYPFYTTAALIASLAGFMAIMALYIYQCEIASRNTMPGTEHGSAYIASAEEMKPYGDWKDERNNLLLSEDIRMRLLGDARDRKYDKNNNGIVVGGSGAGKSFFFSAPNMMQCNGSYLHTEPKGAVIASIGEMYKRVKGPGGKKYKVKVFNSQDYTKSLHYNPLAYTHSQTDVMRFVRMFMDITTGHKNDTGDPFWPKAEENVIRAMVAFMFETDPEHMSIPLMLDIWALVETREDNDDYVSRFDALFLKYEEECQERGYNSYALRQYHNYKKAKGRTAQSVNASVTNRLSPFDLDEVREIMAYDELEIDKMGEEPTYLGIVSSDLETTFGFLTAFIVYQTVFVNSYIADNKYVHNRSQLPVPIQMHLDEFKNIGKLPFFDTWISTIRSRGISAIIYLQSLAQLYEMYKETADTIIDCCDSFVYLSGGRSEKTTKSISDFIGQTTIQQQNVSRTRGGQQDTTSVSTQSTGRALIDPSEVSRMQKGECLVMISGENPVRTKSYNPKNHPNYKYTGYATGKMYAPNNRRSAGIDADEIYLFEGLGMRSEARKSDTAVYKEHACDKGDYSMYEKQFEGVDVA